jgi:transcriptional regulator GlxA family with amidase domain
MLVQRTLRQLAQRLVEQSPQILFRSQVRTCTHRRTIEVGVERYPSSRRLRTISRVMLETLRPRLLAIELTDSLKPSIRWISQRSS